MKVFSVLALALLGAALTLLANRLFRRARNPGKKPGQEFQRVELNVRSMKAQGKLPDTISALEQVAIEICGAEVSGKLKEMQVIRARVARARAEGGGGAPNPEVSLVIPPAFRDPDPDVSLARLFFEVGGRAKDLMLEVKIAAAAAGLAWVFFLVALIWALVS
jgi:hypothetical protein